MVADRRGHTAEIKHDLFTVVGVPLLGYLLKFGSQLVHPRDGVRRNSDETLCADDLYNLFPRSRGKQDLANSAAMSRKSFPDPGYRHLHCRRALKLFHVYYLITLQYG